MDKALKSSLGWILCGVIVLGFIYGYIYIKNKPYDKNQSVFWIETEGVLKENDTRTSSDSLSYIIEYTDKNGAIYKIEISDSSKFERVGNNKLKLFYNSANPLYVKINGEIIESH